MKNFVYYIILYYAPKTQHIQRGLKKKQTYLFEVNVSVAAQGGLDMFCPFFLPLRVFLSPKGIDVMREEGGGLIRGVS